MRIILVSIFFGFFAGICLAQPDSLGEEKPFLPRMAQKIFGSEHAPGKPQFLVYPTLHYQNGGVVIDRNGGTTVPGLFCAGEVTGAAWNIINQSIYLQGGRLSDRINIGNQATPVCIRDG